MTLYINHGQKTQIYTDFLFNEIENELSGFNSSDEQTEKNILVRNFINNLTKIFLLDDSENYKIFERLYLDSTI